MEALVSPRAAETEKAPLHAEDRNSYLKDEFTAEVRRKAAISTGSKDCDCADDHYCCVTHTGGGVREHSTLSAPPDRNDCCHTGKFDNASAAVTFI